MKRLGISAPPTPRSQRGVVLFIALIALVAMTLAAIALVRSVDIGTQIGGNLAFRQSGTHTADAGIEAARKWLLTTTADLTVSASAGVGYWATFNGGVTSTPAIFDPTTFNWATNGSTSLPTDSSGNQVSYVIHRMCENTGSPGTVSTNCVSAPATGSTNNSYTAPSYGDFMCVSTYCNASSNPMYRVTVRSVGPRNTITYIQAVLY